MKKIELWSINKWLRKIGLMIVVEHENDPNDGSIYFWIERSKTYDNRGKQNKYNQ